MSGLTILGLVVGSLFVLAASAWTIVNARYSRMLERELASLRADGYALTLAEVVPKPVPDDQNAALLYLPLFHVNFDPKAGSPGNSSTSGLRSFKVDKTDLTSVLAARSILESAAAQDALAKLKAASLRPYSVFPIRWEDTYNALFPHMAQFRQGTRMVCAEAVLQAHDGKLAEALDWLCVSERMAAHAGQEPTLIGQLVAVAMRAIGDKAAREIITDADLSPKLARPLYDELARADLTSGYERALRTELVTGLTTIEQLAHNPKGTELMFGSEDLPFPPVLVKMMSSGPGASVLKLEEANYAHDMHEMIPTIRQPYRLHPKPETASSTPRFGHMFSALLMPVLGRIGQKRDQCLAQVHLLQIVLALKAQKHSLGSYPERLEGLVWPAPTEDPFSGRPFVYRRQGGGFLLYSLGPNLKDDGGKEPVPKQPGGSRNYQEEGDMVWECKR